MPPNTTIPCSIATDRLADLCVISHHFDQCKWSRKAKSIVRRENVNNSIPAINHSRNSRLLILRIKFLKSWLWDLEDNMEKVFSEYFLTLLEVSNSRIFPAMGECRPSAPQVNL